MQNSILILTDKEEEKKFFTSKCKEKELEPTIPGSVKETHDLLSSLYFPVSLISYSVITKSERGQIVSLFKNTSKSKFILFDVPEDAKKRLAFYKMGAYKILDINYNQEEIVYICNNFYKKQDASIGTDETRFSGNLEDFNLAELINLYPRTLQNCLWFLNQIR